jgi:predicted dehydrogenase
MISEKSQESFPVSASAGKPVPRTKQRFTRRRFLKIAGGALAATGASAAAYYTTRDRIRLGIIGCGDRGSTLADIADKSGLYLWRYGSVVALADVYRARGEEVRSKFCPKADLYQDYKKVLARDDVDAVIIAPPDHWHVAIALQALRAGKAIYHEKPFSHTIAESKLLLAAVKAAGLPFLVGTHQRSMYTCRTAAEMIRNGRLGQVGKATIKLLNKGWRGGPFAPESVPDGLDWDVWLGPAPANDYCFERYRYFHGWWDYGGGEMVNWGSHHLDIAMWAMNLTHTGPVRVSGSAELPWIKGGYDIPADFAARLEFASGQTISIETNGPSPHCSGILFEGERGNLWVDRENLEIPNARDLAPAPSEPLLLHPSAAARRMPAVQHLTHFYDVVRGTSSPISDADSSHKANVALHLANIAIRVGRPICWDPVKEEIVGDAQAASLISAPRRAGYDL